MAIWSASNCRAWKVKDTSDRSKQALKIESTANDGYIYNAYTVVQNEVYYFSIYYKTNSANNTKIDLYDATGSAVVVSSGNLTSTSWTKFDCSFTVPASCVSLQLRLYGITSGDIAYFSDIKLVQNMITGAGFETTDGWTTSNSAIATDSSNEKTGTNCCKVTASAANGYIYQQITVVDGQWYYAIFNGKATAGDSFQFKIIGVTTSTEYYVSDIITTSASYSGRLCAFKVVGDTAIQVRGVAVGNGDIIYFDDWHLAPLLVLDLPASTYTVSDEYIAAALVYYGAYSATRTYNVPQGNCLVSITSIPTEDSGDVTITYDLTDERSGAASVKFKYAFSPTGTYYDMTDAGGLSDGKLALTTSPTGTEHTFVWDTLTDLGTDFKGKLYVKLEAYDRNNYIGDYNVDTGSAIVIDNSPEAPTIVTPTDGYFDKNETPQIVGTIPHPKEAYSDLHMKVEIATDEGFGTIERTYESRNDQTGWEYDATGAGGWTPILVTGIPVKTENALVGRQWRLTIQTEDRLSTGKKYIRAVAGGMNN